MDTQKPLPRPHLSPRYESRMLWREVNPKKYEKMSRVSNFLKMHKRTKLNGTMGSFKQSILSVFAFFRAPSGNSISIRVPEKRPVVPSHWSCTPVSEPCTRVTLDSSSWEFKDVEQLFKASMSNVVIKKIDRAQNPFMWENFQR